MTTRLKGCNYYRVIVSFTHEFDTLVQAPDVESAQNLIERRFPHHRIHSITENNSWWLSSHKGFSS